MKPLIVISGPTASGKTALSVRLAKKIDGEIVCADSMQIYKYMDIGSAKPTAEEQEGVPHHLFGFVSPLESFSLAQYLDIAHAAVAEIHSRGKIPILVGGTGLYIDSLVKNVKLTETAADEEYRRGLEALAEKYGCGYLHSMLSYIDPGQAKKLSENDIRRIIRALEIYKTTGRTKTEADRLSVMTPKLYDAAQFAVSMDRELLYDRINLRVDIMMKHGLVEEVAALKKMGADKSMTSMQGIGYKEMLDYLDGICTLDEAAQMIKKRSRNYAKRQLTWFRKNKDIIWLEYNKKEDMSEKCFETIEKYKKVWYN